MRHCVVFALLVSWIVTGSAQAGDKKDPFPSIGRPSDKQIMDLNECSLAKVNDNCKFVINRTIPVVPSSAIQMYSGNRLVVIVKDEKPFERYFLDPVSGSLTQNPDTASVIIQGMLPALAKVNLERIVRDKVQTYGLDFILGDPCDDDLIAKPLTTGKGDAALLQFKVCIAKLGSDAKSIYGDLEQFTAPDAITPKGVITTESINKALDAISTKISAFITAEAKVTARIKVAAAINDATIISPEAIAELTDYQKPADAIATDLLGYQTRISDVAPISETNPNGFSNQHVLCSELIKEFKDDRKTECVAITSNRDDAQPYQGMVNRTITYTFDSYNLVSYSQQAAVDASKKKALGGNIVINFADETNIVKSPALRWEASAGVFFSSLPIRSFSVLPKFDGTNVTDNVVAQTILRPTVIPYAAGNYRLTDDLRWSKWKSNLYLTAAIGVNPNTVSADFAAGLSLSWRSLMVSPLWHYGHDTRLAGFTVGEPLGAAFKSTLPTQTFWTSSFGVGIGIRIPPITGR